MVLRWIVLIVALSGALQVAAQDYEPLPAGPSALVLIARLHALPGQADQVVALSAAVDKKVQA